jgi:hypothetical protein
MKNIASRGIDEIIWAHDVLDGVLRNDSGMDLGIDETTKEKMRYQRDVLCWILLHHDRDAFQSNLELLVAHAKEHGFELRFKIQ